MKYEKERKKKKGFQRSLRKKGIGRIAKSRNRRTFETKGSKGSGAIRSGPPSAWIPKRQVAKYRGVEWFSRRRVKRGKEGLGCVSLPPSGAHLPSPQQSRTVRSDQELRLRSRTNESLLLSPTIAHFPPPHDRAAPRELFDLLPTLRYPFLRTPQHSHAPSPLFSPSFSSPSCLHEFTRAIYFSSIYSFIFLLFFFFFYFRKEFERIRCFSLDRSLDSFP